MNHDYYAMLAFTFVLLYLQPINCSLSTITRYKRATGNTATDNTAQTSVGEIQQITEDTQIQKHHNYVIKKCELLVQYLEAFNKAIKEKPDKRKGGLRKKFEMKFPHDDGSSEANKFFYAMLKVEFENESSIVNGKPETIAALQKISLGRNAFKLGKKDYMSSNQATSIVETTLHANWATEVGEYLEDEQQKYLPQLVKVRDDVRMRVKFPTQGQTSRASPPQNPVDDPAPMTLQQELIKARAQAHGQTSGASSLQNPVESPSISQLAAAGFSADELNRHKEMVTKVNADEKALEDIIQLQSRLTEEGTKIVQHMISIRDLLSEAREFFDNLAAAPQKKSRKPSHKLGIGKSDGAEYSQMNKYDGTFNPAGELNSKAWLDRLRIRLDAI